MPARPDIAAAVSGALSSLGVAVDARAAVHLERPARREHGDWSTNAALVNAKALGRPPRQIAEELAARLAPRAAAAPRIGGGGGPGLREPPSRPGLAPRRPHRGGGGGRGRVRPQRHGAGRARADRVRLGQPHRPAARRQRMVGRLRRRHGTRHGALRLGRAPRVLRQRHRGPDPGAGREPARPASRRGRPRGRGTRASTWPSWPPLRRAPTTSRRRDAGRPSRSSTTSASPWPRMGIVFDEWYSQASVEESGALARDHRRCCRPRDWWRRRTGRVWFRSERLGDNRDRVLVKSNGDATYLAGDLAYHRDKFLVRGFDRVIDIFGADHAGQVKSLMLGVEAMGVEPGRLEVKIGQMVSLVQGGQAGRMSKRAGQLRGPRRAGRPTSAPTPRACCRSCRRSTRPPSSTSTWCAASRWRTPSTTCSTPTPASPPSAGVRAERGIERRPLDDVDLSLLVHERELEVLRRLEELPDVVADAGRDRAPHKVTAWVRESGRGVPRLLPRLPGAGRHGGGRAGPGPAVARRGGARGVRRRAWTSSG